MPADVREAFVRRGVDRAHVVLKICITPTGEVDSVSILEESTVPEAAQFAASGAEQWRYDPVVVNGMAIPVCSRAAMDIVPGEQPQPPVNAGP